MKEIALYVIAHTWEDVELTIKHFYTPDKAVRYLGEKLHENGFRLPDPTEDPTSYLEEYNEWVHKENDGMSEPYTVELEVIEVQTN